MTSNPLSGASPIPRTTYAIAALAIFTVEVLIALFVKDSFIRPYVGDVLAIAFVYATLRAIFPLRMRSAIFLTLTIATAIEIAQALDVLGALGLDGNTIARVVLGGAFDPMDFAAYGAGALLILAVEIWRKRVPRREGPKRGRESGSVRPGSRLQNPGGS